MLKNLLYTAFAVMLSAFGMQAQIVTTTPSPLQEDSKDVVVYFHADQGNKVLANLPASTEIYAHTGVLTSASKSNSDWKYVIAKWDENIPKALLTYVEKNLYKLEIGDIRTFYGITNPSETITDLAFVFRTADGKKEGKTATGGDIFVSVLDAGLQVSLETSLGANTVITPQNNKVKLMLGSTQDADLSILVNDEVVASKNAANLLEIEYTFPSMGTYTVTGKAVKGDETATATQYLTYVQLNSPQADYPGGVPKMGAVKNNDGSVTFCIAAPNKKGVIMVGNWNDYVVSNDYLLSYQDYQGFRYFWITLQNIDDTKQYIYYYLIDGSIITGDPYAKLVLDPANDKYIPSSVYPNLPAYPTTKIPQPNVHLAVYQGNINDYKWTDDGFMPAAKENLIVYELLLRDFTGTEGAHNGNGTVKQALAKLNYLKTLGVNCIELLPINEFNGNISWGYNPNFYFAPDKAYGTPKDYRDFINACHEAGIAVVLDMVFNQTDWQHPWYQMYTVGNNPFYNASAPHAYSVLNDWNQGYPLVREQFRDVVRYWMEEYHVDGFRFDLVKGLGDNDSYANSGDSGTNAYNESRVKNMRDLQLAMLEVNPNAIFINENLAGQKEENEMAAYGQLNWANLNDAGCEYAMGYPTRAGLNRLLATKDYRTWGSTVSYLESHDEQRLAYKQKTWGQPEIKDNLELSMRRLGSAACQMILAPGAHMIWMFSELGNDQNTKDDNGGNDTDPKLVLWSYYDQPDRHGLYINYAELISIRNDNPDLFAENATYSLDFNTWDKGRYFHSAANGKELHALINPSLTDEITMDVSFSSTNPNDYYIISRSYGTEPAFDVKAGKVTIPSNSYVVICNNATVNGVEEIRADAAAEPVSVEWFDLNGARVANPDKGIYVKRTTYSDGSVRTAKVVR